MAWRRKSKSVNPDAKGSDARSESRRSAGAFTGDLFRRAFDAVEHHLDKGAAFFLGESMPSPEKGAVSSGSLAFDHVSGCGGWPRGRISEVVGPPGSGKTTLALAAIANVQRQGGLAAVVDVERALDRSFAERAGVDLNSLLVIHPLHGEQAIQIVNELIAANAVDLIVVDSVAALVPQQELNEGTSAASKNALARMMSAGLRTMNANLGQSNVALLMLNQLRTHAFDDGTAEEVSAGGDALKYYSAIRVDVRTVQIHRRVVGKQTRTVGQRARLRVLKSKVGRPHEEVHVELNFDRGLDRAAEAIDMGLATGVLERVDGVYAAGERTLGRRESAIGILVNTPSLLEQVQSEIVVRINANAKRTSEGASSSVAASAEDDVERDSFASPAVAIDDVPTALSFVN